MRMLRITTRMLRIAPIGDTVPNTRAEFSCSVPLGILSGNRALSGDNKNRNASGVRSYRAPWSDPKHQPTSEASAFSPFCLVARRAAFQQRRHKKKEPGQIAGLFQVAVDRTANQPRVRVTFTMWPQKWPVTVAVCVAGSNDDERSTSHVPDPPGRDHVKLPTCVCVWRPESAALTMFR